MKEFMKKNIFILFFMLILPSLFAQEQSEKTKYINNQIFSIDTSYLLKGYFINGWGLGCSYEHLLFDLWSIKAGFNHVTIFPQDTDIIITTVGISMSTFIYPLKKNNIGLYFGGGCSTNFLQYINYDNKTGDIVTDIFPQIGWKLSIKEIVFFDISYKYNIAVSNQNLPDFAQAVTKQRNEFGISFKINFKKIYNFLSKKNNISR